MTYTAWDKDPPYEDVAKIDIPFPIEKYSKLLKLCNLEADKDLSDENIALIFVNAVFKWLKGEWSLDDLSCIGNKFWYERKEKNELDELGNALYASSEAGYYIRRIYRPEIKEKNDNFSRFVISIMKYYELNRELVIKE